MHFPFGAIWRRKVPLFSTVATRWVRVFVFETRERERGDSCVTLETHYADVVRTLCHLLISKKKWNTKSNTTHRRYGQFSLETKKEKHLNAILYPKDVNLSNATSHTLKPDSRRADHFPTELLTQCDFVAIIFVHGVKDQK